MVRKQLPIGNDEFDKLRMNDFYYADKTMLFLFHNKQLRLLDFADCLIYYTRMEVTYKLIPYEYNFLR